MNVMSFGPVIQQNLCYGNLASVSTRYRDKHEHERNTKRSRKGEEKRNCLRH